MDFCCSSSLSHLSQQWLAKTDKDSLYAFFLLGIHTLEMYVFSVTEFLCCDDNSLSATTTTSTTATFFFVWRNTQTVSFWLHLIFPRVITLLSPLALLLLVFPCHHYHHHHSNSTIPRLLQKDVELLIFFLYLKKTIKS